MVTIESVLVHGCRPTVCSTVRISIRPSARAPEPPSKAAAAHRPATSMRTRSVGRSIAAGPAGQQIGLDWVQYPPFTRHTRRVSKSGKKLAAEFPPAVTSDPTLGFLPRIFALLSGSPFSRGGRLSRQVCYPGFVSLRVACGSPEPGGILEARAGQWRSACVWRCCVITMAIIRMPGVTRVMSTFTWRSLGRGA